MNSSISIKETEFVNKNLPTKKTLGSDDFTGKVYQTFRGEITPILHKLFWKIKEDILSNSIYKANIIFISK